VRCRFPLDLDTQSQFHNYFDLLVDNEVIILHGNCLVQVCPACVVDQQDNDYLSSYYWADLPEDLPIQVGPFHQSIHHHYWKCLDLFILCHPRLFDYCVRSL
jgi:hypothetical protein